tara:strand:- start:81 stop:512 length:432 start_codon:yes stop_codon:yes gene_type:complete
MITSISWIYFCQIKTMKNTCGLITGGVKADSCARGIERKINLTKNTLYPGQHHWNITMADIKALIKLMKELEYQVARCVCCGMCQAVCPLFEQTGRESDAACGKLALLDGLMQEMIKNPKEGYPIDSIAAFSAGHVPPTTPAE